MEPNKKTLRIAIRKFAPFENTIKKIWEKFSREREEQLSLELVSLELPDLYSATIAQGGLKRGDWDLAIINTDWIFEAYTSGAVEHLQPYFKEDSINDFLQGWSPSLLSLQQFNGNLTGLPFHDGPECLIYRKDLFENKKEQQRFFEKFGEPLQPPKSWEDFKKISEFFQRPEKNLYGTAFAAFPDGHNTIFDFCLQLWTRGGNLTDNKGKINIDSKAAREGLEFYRKILKNKKAVHPESKQFESVRLGEAFAQGEVAMMVNWFGFASVCEVAENSKVKGKVDICSVPSAPGTPTASLNVYYLYVLGSGSKDKDLAFDFMKYAVNAENDKLLTLKGGIGCRTSTWKDAEVNATIPYYHKLEQLHEHAKALPQKSNWSKIAEVIDEVVLEAVNTELPVKEILKKGQEKIRHLEA